MERRGRKPKFSERLKSYSVMLRQDQVEYLAKKENASDWIREAIDKLMETEGKVVQSEDVIVISKRITFLEQRIQQLKNAEEYKKAKAVLQLWKYHPDWKIEDSTLDAYNLRREELNQPLAIKIVEGYEKQIAELETEIKMLEEKIVSYLTFPALRRLTDYKNDVELAKAICEAEKVEDILKELRWKPGCKVGTYPRELRKIHEKAVAILKEIPSEKIKKKLKEKTHLLSKRKSILK